MLACMIPAVTLPAQQFGWEQGQGFRSARLQVPAEGKAGFTRMGLETGVNFTNLVSTNRYTTNQIYLNGSGVAAGDIDSDGLVDLFFCSIDGPNALYRNIGHWRFEESAASAGVAFPDLDCTGAAFADLDGDRDLDLVLNTVGQGTHFLANDGKGKFATAGKFNLGRGGMSLALADIDRDGDLDIYIANYRTSTIRDDPNATISGDYVNGRPVPSKYNGRPLTTPELQGRFTFGPTGKIVEHGELDLLLRNEGGGKFTPLGPTDGLFLEEDGKPLQTFPYDWGLSCMFHDINGDGAPDLYVCNDFESPDRIWINDGKGKFRALSTRSVRHTSMFSMGVDFADVNRDGNVDFFVADMLSRSHQSRQVQTGEVPPYMHRPGEIENRPSYSHNTLFLNRGDSSFAEIAWFARVEASEWSWSPVFLDVDLDGFEDLLVTTGHQLEMMNGDTIEAADKAKSGKQMSRMELLGLRHMFNRFNVANVAFRNRGDLTFEDVSEPWGFAEKAVSHGIALADLDNDGDLDLAVNNLNSPASLYRNNSSAPRVAVRLHGVGTNTRGVGAKVSVFRGDLRQTQEIISGGRYLSSDDAMRVFAAGEGLPLKLEINWPSGKRSVVENARANNIYEILEESAGAVPAAEREKATPIFSEVGLQAAHFHAEEFFDDLQRQVLLPMRLSQLGPGATWHDYDGDGWDDLVIPSGRGGRLAVYKNTGGNLSLLNEPLLQRAIARDQTTALGFGAVLLVGSSNYEDGMTNGGWARIYDLQRKASGENILGPDAAAGPLAAADFDGDGLVDLFVGGRAKAGHYPAPAPSLLLKNEGNRFVIKQRFEALGLVSGALFSDLDGDNDPDLLLACHWGPIRLFRNEKGHFQEATAEAGLGTQHGLWNAVATGDFNNDGQIDFVASNWGQNTRFSASGEAPLKLYYGDFDSNGITDMIEARFEPEFKKEVPLRGYRMMTMGLPFLKERFPTRALYGQSSIEDLLGGIATKPAVVQVTELRSMLFLNDGGKFTGTPLPPEAQFSPGFGLAVADFDGDGNEDLFLAQNFFATTLEMPRSDAGLGLLLLGDGHGQFSPESPTHSGIALYGEQRGSALSDFDQDGRVDLVVSQNAGPTKLFKNTAATPGLRVRLRAPEPNPNAIGAAVRWKSTGPLKEIQAGSGYWSQNSRTLILPRTQAKEIEVRWPGGKRTISTVPDSAREVIISPDGSVQAF